METVPRPLLLPHVSSSSSLTIWMPQRKTAGASVACELKYKMTKYDSGHQSILDEEDELIIAELLDKGDELIIDRICAGKLSMKVGTRIKLITPLRPGLLGTITELRPQNSGALVRFDGESYEWGLGYKEFEVISAPSSDDDINLSRVLEISPYRACQNNYEVDKDHD